MTRISSNQLELLILCGAPDRVLLSPSKTADALVRRGLLERDGGYTITPAGLRALAAEMEAGRVKSGLHRLRKQRAETEERLRRSGHA